MPQGPANYTGAHSYDAQTILNAEMGQHGTASPAGNPEFERSGGRYVLPTTATAVASGADVTQWLDARGYPTPHFEAYLLYSTLGVGTITNFAAATMTGLGVFKTLQVQVNVLATGGSTATLSVYLDSRFDGTNWINVARATTLTTASQSLLVLTKPVTASEVLVTTDAGVGTVRAIGFADDLRLRHTISGATSTFDYTVYVNGIG